MHYAYYIGMGSDLAALSERENLKTTSRTAPYTAC